jgi:transketolase
MALLFYNQIHKGAILNKTQLLAQNIRILIIEESMRAHVGHIASALSIADIIATLYNDILRGVSPPKKQRDIFILSKGHAALAQYCVLYLKKHISKKQLDTYCGEGSLLGVHPEHTLDNIEFSTGSLGQGLAFGIGSALGLRIKRTDNKVYVLMSDAEMNEGSVWESIMFAGHHKLSKLIAIIDNNKQQAMGKTVDILNYSSLSDSWKSFGWECETIDGHNINELKAALAKESSEGKPRLIIANTVAGKGVSFMEGLVKWHYLPLTEDGFKKAMGELK